MILIVDMIPLHGPELTLYITAFHQRNFIETHPEAVTDLVSLGAGEPRPLPNLDQDVEGRAELS